MKIREITTADTDGFIDLAAQLGYTAERDYLEKRILNRPDDETVFVADCGAGIIGWIAERSGSCFSRLIIHTNMKRERAHRFYESNGYECIKTSKLYMKEF